MFQSRYRAASHFRVPPIHNINYTINKFQSRYRAASHFRSCGGPVSGVLYRFQSRYRAASHFRLQFCNGDAAFFSGVVSISLSSGFSFQEALDILAERRRVKFQSRYRAASHFRTAGPGWCFLLCLFRFNLVIERLLISGTP